MSDTFTPNPDHYLRGNLDKPTFGVVRGCGRCGGSGIYSYYHGACYECGGSGHSGKLKDWVLPTSWTDEQVIEWVQAREAKRQQRAAKAQAKRQAQYDANLEAHEGLAEAVAIYRERELHDGFVSDVLYKAWSYELSEAQANAVVAAIGRLVERAERDEAKASEAAANPLPEGRYEIEGTIVSTKWQSSQYGETLKMLVVLDNELHKVWGTVPSALWDDADKGARVRFTATVERSEDDPAFGFYKRPTKAEVLEGVAV